jgi:hypothetical protein
MCGASGKVQPKLIDSRGRRVTWVHHPKSPMTGAFTAATSSNEIETPTSAILEFMGSIPQFWRSRLPPSDPVVLQALNHTPIRPRAPPLPEQLAATTP